MGCLGSTPCVCVHVCVHVHVGCTYVCMYTVCMCVGVYVYCVCVCVHICGVCMYMCVCVHVYCVCVCLSLEYRDLPDRLPQKITCVVTCVSPLCSPGLEQCRHTMRKKTHSYKYSWGVYFQLLRAEMNRCSRCAARARGAGRQVPGPSSCGSAVGSLPSADPLPFVPSCAFVQPGDLCSPNLSVISDWPSFWQLFGLKLNTSDKFYKDENLAKGLFCQLKHFIPQLPSGAQGAPSAVWVSRMKRESVGPSEVIASITGKANSYCRTVRRLPGKGAACRKGIALCSPRAVTWESSRWLHKYIRPEAPLWGPNCPN